MARFYGKIGFAQTVETEPGIWTQQITERAYIGDVQRQGKRNDSSGPGGQESANGSIVVSNYISVLADQFLNENFYNIAYVEWRGTRWRVSSTEVNHPRLTLYFGEVYHAPEA